jgi:hypothetical protein
VEPSQDRSAASAGGDGRRAQGLTGDRDRHGLGGIVDRLEQAPLHGGHGDRDRAVRRRRVVGDDEEERPAELRRGHGDRVGVVDQDLQVIGQRGVELARLVVDGDLFLILGRGDLRQVEMVAHATSTVRRPRKPRPTWPLI